MLVSPQAKELQEESDVCLTFSVLLATGLPILSTLRAAGASCDRLTPCFQIMHDEVRDGGSLTDGLDKADQQVGTPYFPPFVRQLIDVGEHVGDLDKTMMWASQLLARLADRVQAGTEVPATEVGRLVSYKMLATLIGAGLGPLRSFEIMEANAAYPGISCWANISGQLHGGVKWIKDGAEWTKALAAYPKDFPEPIVDSLRQAITEGQLEAKFNELVAHLETVAFGAPFSVRL
jgi:type II secretory pathway component PulF